MSARQSWLSLGSLTAVGWVVVWALLVGGAVVGRPALAVVASVAALVWAGMCVVLTHRDAAAPRIVLRPRKGAPRRRWWSGEWWLVPLMAVLVSPAATHWIAGRTRGGRLRFGDGDAAVVETAQLLGWAAVAVVLLGCPLAWLVGRRRRRHEGTRARGRRDRFHGVISGLGSTSGTRVVVGHWSASPYGAFADAMVERSDGHRVLVAGSSEIADFVAATYEFDEIRVEPVEVLVTGDRWRLRSTSLRLDWTVGRRTGLGWLLRCIPRSIAQAPWWCSLTDVVARVVLTGVRTRGSAGNGRREWYGATDNRRVLAATGSFDGHDLGTLAPVDPPPAFGFSSTPRDPSSTEVVSTVEAGV